MPAGREDTRKGSRDAEHARRRRRHAIAHHVSWVLLIWGISSLVFGSAFSRIVLGNLQGGDVLLNLAGTHSKAAGTEVANLSVDAGFDVVFAIWYVCSGKAHWELHIEFRGPGGTVRLEQTLENPKCPKNDAGGAGQIGTPQRLPLPGIYAVFVVGPPAANLTDSRLFVSRVTTLEGFAHAPHVLWGLSTVIQFLALRHAYPMVRNSRVHGEAVVQAIVTSIEVTGHFFLTVGVTIVWMNSGLGVPLNWPALVPYLGLAGFFVASAAWLRRDMLR